MKTLLTSHDFKAVEHTLPPGTMVITSIGLLHELKTRAEVELRDKFAMAAIAGISRSEAGSYPASAAFNAYEIADQMLSVRAQNKKEIT